MVLQRWQTVYLAVAAVLMIVFAFFPAIEISLPDGVYALGASFMGKPGTSGHPDVLLLTLDVLIVVMLVVTTFSYRNLRRQMRQCAITMALTVALLITIGVLGWRYAPVGDVTFTAFNALPVIALVGMMMARRGMAADKRLLSESDRLR